MKKTSISILMIIFIFMCPLIVFATTANSNVYKGSNSCLNSTYQDANIKADGIVYFSHCLEAKCTKNNYNLTYASMNKVTCSNGNTSPYYEVVKSACEDYRKKVCNEGTINYCSMIIKYDCNKTSSGANYFTTTTTKKTTTKRRTTSKTTTTTTEPIKSNTKLKSLTLSTGTINFSPEVYEYTIDIESNVTSINVSAVPEESTSKIEIKDNTNLENGSVIKVIVTGEDSSVSEYKININKEVYIMSSNTNLNYLNVEGYELGFSSNINDYYITIDRGITELIIDYETEDEKSVVTIDGNENLSNGSKVTVTVTAEDGTESKYIINIMVKKKSNFIKILFIIILVLAILAGAYYIYKKFVQSKTGEKYEYE